VVQITIEVNDADLADLARAFDDGNAEDLGTKFATLAMREHLEWITGQSRFRSLTEEHLRRIERIYEAMLPDSEAPSFNRLYNSFNLPHGQAMYLARALSDKSQRKWRDRAIADLLADLKRIEPQVQQRQAADDGAKGLNVRTSKIGARELSALCDNEFKTNRAFVGMTPKGGVGEQRVVELPADSIAIIIATLEAEVAHGQPQ
jgi:hypothetical protein